MSKIVIIIPSRLSAKRLPNKPLKPINNKEMILHVYESASKSVADKVLVASPDTAIVDLIKKNGGLAFKSQNPHETGTDRVYEAFDLVFKNDPDVIINLQGDMPNINKNSINFLINYMKKNICDIGTLAGKIKNSDEINDPNVVKVLTKNTLKEEDFSTALDFFRIKSDIKNNIYHHIGIYGFTREALIKFVNLKRSKLELERNLEQLRALEHNMKIHVGFSNNIPLSVDTEQDYISVKKYMSKND
tara:strand:- start:1423 stop:2160 length:738 start_codon:yes stop_codon:yes gene_type:complete